MLNGTDPGVNYEDFIDPDFTERPDKCYIIVLLCQLRSEGRSGIDVGPIHTGAPSGGGEQPPNTRGRSIAGPGRGGSGSEGGLEGGGHCGLR